jgi:hypothetical protein
MRKQTARSSKQMTVFAGHLMAFADPIDPAKPLRPFYRDLTPDTLEDAREVVEVYNLKASREACLTDVLGLFPLERGACYAFRYPVRRKRYFIGMHDPLDVSATPAPIDQTVADTMREARSFVARFNAYVADHPKVFRLAGLFRCDAFPQLSVAGGVADTHREYRIEIVKVRDLREQPLEAYTVALAPHRPRGIWQVTGLDLDRMKLRTFYVEQMRDLRPIDPPDLVLAAYDPAQPELAPVPVPREAMGENRTFLDKFTLMMRCNVRAAEDPESHRLLGLFPPSDVAAAVH